MEEAILNSDIVFTGEGSFDAQTAQGKVISLVQEFCKIHKKPLIVVCGRSEISEKIEGIDVFDMSSRYGVEASMNDSKNTLQKLVKVIIDNTPKLQQ